MGKRADAEEAYRARAGLIGALHSCVCRYPRELAATSTGHDQDCGAHVMLCTPEERALLPGTVRWSPRLGYRGCCRTCGAELEIAPTIAGLRAQLEAQHRHPAEVTP